MRGTGDGRADLRYDGAVSPLRRQSCARRLFAALAGGCALLGGAATTRADAPEPVAAKVDRFASPEVVCGDGLVETCGRLCYERHDAAACYEAGRAFEWGTNGADVDLWRSRAFSRRAGRPGAARGCNGAGYQYGTGTGPPTDYVRAVRLYQRACEAGLPLGCYNIGVMHESAPGVPRSLGAAAIFYRRGCDGGNANACSSLGVFLFKGTAPVAFDPVEGLSLLRRGCAGGNQWGCDRLKDFGFEP
jgi:hypothetical protein